MTGGNQEEHKNLNQLMTQWFKCGGL